MAKELVYQIHSKLLDYKPSMWRRFKISAKSTLAELAFVLMDLYKMGGRHLFAFEIPRKDFIKTPFNRGDRNIRYEIPHPDNVCFGHFPEDVNKSLLAKVIKEEKEKFYFEYDFGDGWEFCLKLEKILEEDAKDLPIVMAGKGYGIIEDCGGPYGLMDIDEALMLKRGEKYKNLIEWCGHEFLNEYSSCFNVEEANASIKTNLKDYREFYEELPLHF